MSKNSDLFLHLLFLFAIIALSVGFVFLYQKVINLPQVNNSLATVSSLVNPLPAPTIPPITQATDECGSNCQKYIDQKISDALSQIPSPQPVKTQTSIQTAKQTSYIPMGSETSTTSTDWVDVPGSEVTLNLANDYATSATVTFEASLKVANANGTAFARLFDDTHKIAVNGSDLSVINSADYVYKISTSLSLWSGTNTYKVQIKSLNSFVISITSSKMKISY